MLDATETQGFAGAPTPSDGTLYLNGVPQARKALKTKGSRRPKRAIRGGNLAAAQRSAKWAGYDGERGCRIYVFHRTLSRRSCEHFGLRYPALEPMVYRPANCPQRDQYHPDHGVAGRAVDRAAQKGAA